MSRYDVDSDFEGQVRAELRRTMVPPSVPEYVREKVEDMAQEHIAATIHSRRNRTWFRRPLVLVRLAAMAVVLAVVAGTIVLIGSGSASGPTSGQALPPAPADPLATPGPTFSTGFDFAGGSTATLLDVTADGGVFVYEQGKGMRVSTDSGVTWSEARSLPVPPPTADVAPMNVDFSDSLHGWQLGVSQTDKEAQFIAYRTDDSGQHWTPAPVATLERGAGEYGIDWAHFVSPERGVLYSGFRQLISGNELGTCSTFTTTDGGRNWSSLALMPCVGSFQPPIWSTDMLGFALTLPGQLAVTEDGGFSWKTGTLPSNAGEMGAQGLLLSSDGPVHLRYVEEITPKNGADWPPREAIFESSDGGATWQESYSGRFPGQVGIGGIVAVTPNLWMTSMSGSEEPGDQLIESRDAGRTWLALPGPHFPQVTSMQWWDGRRGVLQVWNTSCTPESQQPAARSGEPAPTAWPSAPDPACARSSVLVTNDGGETWHHVPF